MGIGMAIAGPVLGSVARLLSLFFWISKPFVSFEAGEQRMTAAGGVI